MTLPAPPDNELVTAVRRLNWEPTGEMPGVFSTWRKAGTDVLIPLDSTRSDFPVLADRARRTIEEVDGDRGALELRSASLVVRRGYDVTRFARDNNLAEGLINWHEGRDLFNAAEKSIIAAAKAVEERRRYHGNSGAYLARKVLDSTVMGQTEVGSFIVTALLPTDASFFLRQADENKLGMLPLPGPVSGRQVSNTFQTAISATREAVTEFERSNMPRVEVFDDLVSEGVSSEFLQSLVLIVEGAQESAISIETTTSGDAPTRTEVVFQSRDATPLAMAADHFHQTREVELRTITGRITLLERPGPQQAGMIRVESGSISNPRKYRLQISAGQYNDVVNAFRDGYLIRATGELELRGRNFWMAEPSFSLLPPTVDSLLNGEDSQDEEADRDLLQLLDETAGSEVDDDDE